jgi:hypothetical protein
MKHVVLLLVASVAAVATQMEPYKAKRQEHDRKLAELRAYALEEMKVEKEATRKHDVAGLLLQAQKVAWSAIRAACEGELKRVQIAAAAVRGIAFTDGAECAHFGFNYDWFQKMASDRGKPGDAEFVGLYRRTYPGSEMFAFQEQASDVGACANYGSGTIGDLYAGWRAHLSQYPGSHADGIMGVMSQLVEFLAPEAAACACNDSLPAIVSELELFLKAAPGDPASVRVQQELQRLKAKDSSHWRLSCIPG